MPYDIRLPSGVIAKGVPDRIKEDEALKLLRTQFPQEFPAPEEAPFTKGLEAFKATVGTGIEALTSPESANREIARRALLEQQDIGARFTGGADFSKVKDINTVQIGCINPAKLIPLNVSFKGIPSSILFKRGSESLTS